jgi:hypothetical protein
MRPWSIVPMALVHRASGAPNPWCRWCPGAHSPWCPWSLVIYTLVPLVPGGPVPWWPRALVAPCPGDLYSGAPGPCGPVPWWPRALVTCTLVPLVPGGHVPWCLCALGPGALGPWFGAYNPLFHCALMSLCPCTLCPPVCRLANFQPWLLAWNPLQPY